MAEEFKDVVSVHVRVAPNRIEARYFRGDLIEYSAYDTEKTNREALQEQRDSLAEQRMTLAKKNHAMFELPEDLDTILGTALHNGHHDLIARVKDIVAQERALR